MIVKFLDKFGKLVKSITSIGYLPVDMEPVKDSKHLSSSGAVANIGSSIAPNYTKTTYPANSYVMQGGVLYTNPNAIGTAEYWNPAHWTQTTIPEVIDNKIDEVTLDPSEVALGNVHLLDEVTSFAADAKILVDSETNGPGAMPAENLLKVTAQNALAGNVAPAFDPTRTNVNPYKAGESVAYEGKTYTFKVDHTGPWNSSHVRRTSFDEILEISNKELVELVGDNLGKISITYGSPSTPTYESGKYYKYTDGDVGNSSGYYKYDLVDVSGSRYAKITNVDAGGGLAGIVFFDSNNHYVSGFHPTAVGDVVAKVPFFAKYIGISSKTTSVTLSLSSSESYFYDRLPALENFEEIAKRQICTRTVTSWSGNQSITWTNGKYYSRTTGDLGNNADYYYSNLIDVSEYDFLKVTNVTGVSGTAGFVFFDENAHYISGLLPDSGDFTFEIPRGAKYIGLSNKTNSSDYNYPTAINEAYDVIPNMKYDLSYIDVNFFRKNPIRMYPAIKTLGAVCFTWDDGYIQYDTSVVNKFDEHNAKCGFALISRTIASSGTKNDYIKLQRRGFTLLNHSINGDALTTYATKSAALAAISEAKNYFENNGMLVNGWVCPGNTYVDNYRECLGNFHGYAFGDHGTGEGIATQDVNTKTQDILRLRRWQIEDATTTLQDVKDIIDECAENGYLLVFYGHAARLTNPSYHSIDWYDDVLNYIQTKYNNGEIFFGSPDECVRYYYDV